MDAKRKEAMEKAARIFGKLEAGDFGEQSLPGIDTGPKRKTEAEMLVGLVHQAASELDAKHIKETNSERLLGDLTRRAFMPRDDAEEVDPGDAYDALLQLTPSVAERFAETWRRAEPWEDVEGQIAERRHARERAEHYRERNEANEEALRESEEIGQALGEELAGMSAADHEALEPIAGDLVPFLAEAEDAADARSRFGYAVRGAREVDRAAEEQETRTEIMRVAATDSIDDGWGDDSWTPEKAALQKFGLRSFDEVEPNFRLNSLSEPETPDEIRAGISDNSLGDSYEDFVADAPAKEEADPLVDRSLGDA